MKAKEDVILRPCPACGEPSRVEQYWSEQDAPMSLVCTTGPALTANLRCGCKIDDDAWIREHLRIEDESVDWQRAIHEDHIRRCPCEACRASAASESVKSADKRMEAEHGEP